MTSTRNATAPRHRAFALWALIVSLVLGLALVPLATTSAGAEPEPASSKTVIGGFEVATEGWVATATGGAKASFARIKPQIGAAEGTMVGVLGVEVPVSGVGSASLARTFEPGLDTTDLTFQLRSGNVNEIGVAVTDSDGQRFEQKVTVNRTAAGYTPVEITDFTGGTGQQHTGGTVGNGDGVWRGPLTSVAFVVHTDQVVAGITTANILVDDVQVTSGPVPLTLSQRVLGNVFTVGQTPSVDVATNGVERLSWQVRNLAGRIVARGQGTPAELNGRLRFTVKDPGWYRAQVSATTTDNKTVTAETDLALLTKFDQRKYADASRVGVATHYALTWDQDSIPLISKAGFGHARDEARWSGEELVKGQYKWPASSIEYTDKLKKAGVDLFFVYAYGNPLYPRVGSLKDDTGRKAFAQYAVRATKQFRNLDPKTRRDQTMYEVWNEWNPASLGTPCPDDELDKGCKTGANYAKLLAETAKAVRAKYPESYLVGPTMAGYDGNWMSDLFANGGLDNLDAVSFHPYTYPGHAEALSGYLTDVKKRMAAAGGVKPIVLSEVGWPTGVAARSVSEQQQADDLVRSITLALTSGVSRYTIYDLIDDGLDQTDTEQTFGLLRNPGDPRGKYVPKPSFVSVSALMRAIAGREAVRLVRPSDTSYDAQFAGKKGGELLHVLWSTTNETATLKTKSAVRVTDLMGVTQTYRPDARGEITLSLGSSPIYVDGKVSAVTPGGKYGFTVADSTPREKPVGTLTAQNPTNQRLVATAAIGNQKVRLVVPPKGRTSVEVNLPATDQLGERTDVAVISTGGKRVARLASVSKVIRPATLRGAHAQTAEGKDVLRFRVANVSQRELTIEGVDWKIGTATGTELAGTTVPVGETKTVDVPVTPGTDPTAWTATLRLGGADEPLTVTGKLLSAGASPLAVRKQSVTIDGTPDAAVTALPPIDLTTDGTAPTGQDWTGPNDLSGKLWWTYDDDNLYLTADIVDDKHDQAYAGEQIWQGDGLQLGVGAGAPGEATAWSELGIALGPNGPSVHRWLTASGQTGAVPGAKSAVKRTEPAGSEPGHTRYELAVPWSSLQPYSTTDRLLGLSAVVNENDGAGRTGWYLWGGGIAGKKDSALFKAARLDS